MKTNLLKIVASIRVPDGWDHDKCAELRADPAGYPNPRNVDERLPFPPGPIDQAIEAAMAELAAKLTAINPEIELATEVQR